LISLATYFVFGQLSRNVRVLASMMLVLLLMNNWLIEQWTVEDNIFRHRNYYGVMKVRTNLGVNYLTHGSILHGAQSVDPESRHIPLVYYHPKAGVGGIMLHGDFDFTDIGIIGLGTGALAAYGKNGDTIDFYELDEDVYDIAKKYFTFLKYSRARTNVILGDARISLENVPKKKYDLLICDAFGGDSIPVHLLTIEAIDQYRKHLKEGGIVLFHFSNRFLDLGNVLTKNGWENNAHVATKKNSANSNIGLSTSWWMSMTWDKEKHDMMIDRLNWIEPDDTLLTDVRPWSDDYSNITPYIRMRDLWSEFLRFRPFTL
jgi:spermidine synthase